ncbi:hypothetical protein MKEN_00320300 [Mycena kentingensis (nom. inval.)]|nr:hypothetical protein MKEN_00320300 [Mycena kentingensis (nom. inval.)]
MQSPVASSSSLTLPAPAAACPQTTTLADDFFGHPLRSSRTRDSRHDQFRVSMTESLSAPPPYVECPEYSLRAPEPDTLAMYLFKFGFLFPPFWILGVIILMSPLRAPPADSLPAGWLPEKTDAERQVFIDRMRITELKWARRCLYALIAVFLLGTVVGVAIWATLRS